jgi:hypothetical protein
MSATGAKAEMISETGAVMPFLGRAARTGLLQTVLMLIESLPTGIVMPRAGQSSMPTGVDGGVKIGAVAGNRPGRPSSWRKGLTRPISPTCAAARFGQGFADGEPGGGGGA